jgi:hypothetical protein
MIGVNRVVHSSAKKAEIIIRYFDSSLLKNIFNNNTNVLYESIDAVLPSNPYSVSNKIKP